LLWKWVDFGLLAVSRRPRGALDLAITKRALLAAMAGRFGCAGSFCKLLFLTMSNVGGNIAAPGFQINQTRPLKRTKALKEWGGAEIWT
jgi:hypothetical protein